MAVNPQSCNRCGYQWSSKLTLPKECPQCKSRYWNLPRQRGLAKHKKRALKVRIDATVPASKTLCPRCQRLGPIRNCRECWRLQDKPKATEPPVLDTPEGGKA
jgi:hypothetical protein